MKKTKINNRLYDVLSEKEFRQQQSTLKINEVAVQVDDLVLPYNGAIGYAPGYYNNGLVCYPVMPDQKDAENYNSKVLDFSKARNGKELMEMNKSLKSLEKDILVSSDNVYTPKIRHEDTPEMAGFKTAIQEKGIDINLYQDRFGSSFNNDLRIINNSPSITFPKLKDMMGYLDMKGTLIIEDQSEDVPNPIGRQIIIPLTGGEE